MVRLDKKVYGQFSKIVPLNFVTLRIQIKKTILIQLKSHNNDCYPGFVYF